MKLQGVQGITYSYLRAAQPTQTPATTNPVPPSQTTKISFGRGEQKACVELAKLRELCASRIINGKQMREPDGSYADHIWNKIATCANRDGFVFDLSLPKNPQANGNTISFDITAMRFGFLKGETKTAVFKIANEPTNSTVAGLWSLVDVVEKPLMEAVYNTMMSKPHIKIPKLSEIIPSLSALKAQ